MPTQPRLKERRPPAAPERYQDEPVRQEPWLGRLRLVFIPVIAVVAIVALIYFLEDKPSAAQLPGDAESTSASGGGFQRVQVGPSSAPPPRIGGQAADFSLADLEGRQVKLSDFRGKAIFMNFFATWCPPCRAEMPDILATYEENKSKGAIVLAVDLQEDAPTVINYAKTVGLTFPVVLDRYASVSSLYRITGLPTSFFIDRQGVIRDMQIGAMSKTMMQTRLSKALQE